MASATGTTFRATNKEPEKCYNYANGGLHHDLINRTYGQCTEVLQSSQFSTRDWFSDNGFVNTLEKCNGGHHNLVLRPDDVWATIMTQFSFYINKHAEEFRTKFVKFEGKKELRLGALAASIRSAPYDLLVKAMSEQIHENLVDPEVKKWILPSFSTTTDNDLVTVGVIFMATMKRYFSYAFDISMCGIPWITLEGTIDDWKDVYSRLDKLKEYKLEKWYNMLKPILREFVNAKKGKVNKSFWQRVCHHDSDGFMSGATEYLSGWITAFCVFDEDGNWNGTHTYSNMYLH